MSSYSHNRDFLFCNLCGTLLHFPSVHYAQCPLCKTKTSLEGIKDREISHTISEEQMRRELGINLIEDVVMKKCLCNRICEKCGHDEASYYTRQMRSADEGQTTFYTCTKCDHQFQEN